MRMLPQSPTPLRWDEMTTEEKNDALRVLAKEGLSSGEIAKVLDVSRNKVMGQCWRWGIALGKDERPSRFRSSTSGKTPPPGLKRRKKYGSPPTQEPGRNLYGENSPMWTPLEGVPPLVVDDLPLRGRCRWPVHPPGVPGNFCCGATTTGKHAFCDTHHARAFRGLVDWETELAEDVTDA